MTTSAPCQPNPDWPCPPKVELSTLCVHSKPADDHACMDCRLFWLENMTRDLVARVGEDSSRGDDLTQRVTALESVRATADEEWKALVQKALENSAVWAERAGDGEPGILARLAKVETEHEKDRTIYGGMLTDHDSRICEMEAVSPALRNVRLQHAEDRIAALEAEKAEPTPISACASCGGPLPAAAGTVVYHDKCAWSKLDAAVARAETLEDDLRVENGAKLIAQERYDEAHAQHATLLRDLATAQSEAASAGALVIAHEGRIERLTAELADARRPRAGLELNIRRLVAHIAAASDRHTPFRSFDIERVLKNLLAGTPIPEVYTQMWGEESESAPVLSPETAYCPRCLHARHEGRNCQYQFTSGIEGIIGSRSCGCAMEEKP